MPKDIMQPSISYQTIFRLQKLTGKPLRRGFDTTLNEILDDYEKLEKSYEKLCQGGTSD